MKSVEGYFLSKKQYTEYEKLLNSDLAVENARLEGRLEMYRNTILPYNSSNSDGGVVAIMMIVAFFAGTIVMAFCSWLVGIF